MLADAGKTIRVMAQMNDDARLIMSMTGIDTFGALLITLETVWCQEIREPKKLILPVR